MLIEKSINAKTLINWTWVHAVLLLSFSGAVAALYFFDIIKFKIPWLPVSVIGTAVAFYVGFKNSQAYDRMWEARKIWGGIVNDSRTFGMMVDGYITNQFVDTDLSEEELHEIKQRLIYRHVAWLYAHRSQLLIPTSWEHISQGKRTSKTAKYYQDNFGIGLVADEATKVNLEDFLPKDEFDRLINYKNTATQIINEQSKDIQYLREKGVIDDFRHMEMVNVLRGFYTLQGKNERIKKFPLPRQYANMSGIFVFILVALLPFSMMPALQEMGGWAVGISIPVTALISWVYVVMESVGDFTENPFQGMANDIPMLSLCRIIEIDMREMLGETDLPPNVEAKKGVLM